MNADAICICGHRWDHHEQLSTYSDNPEDDVEIWCATDLDMNCECDTFVPDNLKYLESKI